jgi:solute:Na+ symporter, SSS family
MVNDMATEYHFGVLNWIVFIAYLVMIFSVGSIFARRQTSTREFFKSGGRMHWLPVALSIVASLFSGIAFLSHPARVFRYDSVLLIYGVSVVLITPIVVYVMLPFYRRLDVTTAYEYLEKRFNLNTRLLASILFICKRLFWLSMVALAPSLALSVFTGIRVEYCVMIIGIITTIYTGLGGMTAVIWADAVQFVVFMIGQIVIIASVAFKVDGGLLEVYRLGWENHKAGMSMDFDLARLTFWTMLISGVAIALSDMGSDQLIVQRYMATPDLKATRKSLWFNALIKIPSMAILLGIGVSLWAFYHIYPNRLTLTSAEYDKIVPFYIVNEIPAGLGGLVIAGVFAAAMSSFDSGLNSLVTAVSVDWHQRVFFPGRNDRHYLISAKITTFILGLSVTLSAILIYRTGIQSIVDASNTYQGFFGGGLLGLFILGMLTRRARALPCVLGIIISVAVVTVIDLYQPKPPDGCYIHPYLYCAITFLLTMAIGYFGSFIGPPLPFEKIRDYTLIKKSLT